MSKSLIDKVNDVTKFAKECREMNCPLCGSEKYSTRGQQITVILPIPDSRLSPNRPPASRGGRIKKSIVAKEYRKLTEMRVREQCAKNTPWKKAVCLPIFYSKTNIRKDSDNFCSMLKPAYDGLTDAGLIIDDDSKHLKREECRFLKDKDNPRIELVIFELEG